MRRIFMQVCVVSGFVTFGLGGAVAEPNSMTGSAHMAGAPSVAASRSFCGTVVMLTEAGCIGVKSSMVGQPVYEITSARPKPPVGSLISGSGTPGGVSFCMQGTHLARVRWTKAAACPLAGGKGR